MKLRLLALCLVLLLSACAAPRPPEAAAEAPPETQIETPRITPPETPLGGPTERPTVPPPETQAETPPPPGTQGPPPTQTPPDEDTVRWAQRRAELTARMAQEGGTLTPPYVTKLLPVGEGEYADGDRLYTIGTDGAISYRDFIAENAAPVPIVQKQADYWYSIASQTARELLRGTAGEQWMRHPWLYYIAKEDGWHYFSLLLMSGGGSGEFYRNPDAGQLIAVSEAGEYKDYGDFRGGYTQLYNGRFYYLALEDFREDCIAFGALCSMAPDGSDVQVLDEHEAQGAFYIYRDVIYYLRTADQCVYTVNVDGTNLQKRDEEKFPFRCPWPWYGGMSLAFCGDFLYVDNYGAEDVQAMLDLNGDRAALLPDALAHVYLEILGWDGTMVLFRAEDDYWAYRAE